MAFTITMDWLVCLYYLIENIFFVYCTDLRMKNYYLQNELYPREFYCFEPEEVSIDTICPMNSENISIKEEPIITTDMIVQSDLNSEAEALLEELQLELTSFEPVQLASEEVSNELDFTINQDCISLSDYDIDCSNSNELTTFDFEKLATAKISDSLEGEQQWVVSIIGTEEEYLHISDGHRTWINVGQDALRLKRGDLLAVDVVRKDKRVEVLNITILESAITEDYLIPDEEIDYNNSYSNAI
jgi:hypothetical protein